MKYILCFRCCGEKSEKYLFFKSFQVNDENSLKKRAYKAVGKRIYIYRIYIYTHTYREGQK